MIVSGQTVTIRRQWNDWIIAEAPVSALDGFRWSDLSGGVARPSPPLFIHTYVRCDAVIGDINHACSHGQGPHLIKVFIFKKDNGREVMSRILDTVGPKPVKEGTKSVPVLSLTRPQPTKPTKPRRRSRSGDRRRRLQLGRPRRVFDQRKPRPNSTK